MRSNLPDAERSAWIAKSVRRIPETSIDPRVKNYHWGDFTAGIFEAKDRGYETVILLDSDDNVTEGPGFNVFVVKNGRLCYLRSWHAGGDQSAHCAGNGIRARA